MSRKLNLETNQFAKADVTHITMRIIIADDTNANLEAAKQGLKEMNEHEFFFTSSAVEALEKLPEYDAIVTDLFFPEEHLGSKTLENIYLRLVQLTDIPEDDALLQEVCTKYFKGDLEETLKKLRDSIEFMKEGTCKGLLLRSIETSRQKNQRAEERIARGEKLNSWDMPSNEWIERCEESIENLPSPMFPYGAAILLEASNLRKKHVLVTDLHSHAGRMDGMPSRTLYGVTLLLALVRRGIVTVQDLIHDGADTNVYIGSNVLSHVKANSGWKSKEYGDSKQNPAVWVKAVDMVNAQN